MVKINNFLGMILMAGMACGIGSASTISLPTQTITPQSGSFFSALDFLQFNQNLGTLTSVEIDSSANFSVTFTINDNTGSSGTYSNAYGYGGVDVLGPADLDIFLQGNTATQSGSISNGATINFSNLPASKSQTSFPTDLADFIGTGTSQVELDFLADGYGANGTGLGGLQYSANGSTGGTVGIIYTYTPSTGAPEPATWAMMGGALLALIATRKRLISRRAS